MARRRKGEDEEEWVPPAFDEVEFMRQEVGAAKASVVSVLYAFPVALVSYVLTLARLPIVAFFVGFALIFLLYYIMPLTRPFTHIDTSKFKRKDWIGHGSIVFFSWLAFSILLLNPPFGDFTRPDITNVAVAGMAATTATNLGCKALFPGDNGGVALGGNTTLYVTFRATDNVAVGSVNATLEGAGVTLVSAEGNQDRCHTGASPSGTREGFVVPAPRGLVHLTIVAVDLSGNSRSLAFTFNPS